MFRELVRKHLQLPQSECIELLKTEKRGVLSVLGDDDYPYGMPMNHFYDEETGKLYFHSGNGGHKIDAIKHHDKISYCLFDKGWAHEGDWILHVRSVVIFGRARIIEDQNEAVEITPKLSYKFTDDTDFIENTIKAAADRLLCFELVIEDMKGKLVTES